MAEVNCRHENAEINYPSGIFAMFKSVKFKCLDCCRRLTFKEFWESEFRKDVTSHYTIEKLRVNWNGREDNLSIIVPK